MKRDNLFTRHPLISFYVLAYSLFWGYLLIVYLTAMFVAGGLDKLSQVTYAVLVVGGSWTPTAAGIIVTGMTGGRKAVRALLVKYTRFNVQFRWYLAAMIPLGLCLAGGLAYLTLGGKAPGGVPLTAEFWILLFLGTLLQGAGGEEIGWHGFALPRLMNRYTPVKSALLLGLFWDLWHLPLWFMGDMTGSDLFLYILGFNIGIYSLAVLMSWVYIHTTHTLIPMIMMHYFFNFGMMLVSDNGLGLMPEVPLLLVTSGLHLLAAILVLTFGLTMKRANKQHMTNRINHNYGNLDLINI